MTGRAAASPAAAVGNIEIGWAGSAAAGRVGTANAAALRPKGKQIVSAGDRVRVDLPGGGGHGDPHERPLEAIAAGIAEGYVTAEAAQDLYGVSVGGDGTVTRQTASRGFYFLSW